MRFGIAILKTPGLVVTKLNETSPAWSLSDSVMQTMNLGKVRLIKIDVEGAELQVLAGSIKTLSRDKPIIVFEHGLGAAEYYNTRPEQVFELLSSCGLCISSLSCFLRRRRSFTKEEFTKIF